MTAKRGREPRQPVKIGARLKSERGWSDVVIRNVSSRGMMGVCREPPERGDYVEVRCGTYVIVARIAWKAESSFGAQAQAAIELAELLAGSAGRAAVPERRKLPRLPEKQPHRSLAETVQASARAARAFDFVAIVAVAAAFAALVAGQAYAVLGQPLNAAAEALAPPVHS